MADSVINIVVKGTEAQRNKLAVLEGQLAQLTAQRRIDTKEVKLAGGADQVLNRRLAETNLRLKGTRAEITKNTREIRNFGQATKKQGGLVSGITKGLTNSFKQLGGAILIAFGGRAILGAIGNAINIFKDFQQEQANLQVSDFFA